MIQDTRLTRALSSLRLFVWMGLYMWSTYLVISLIGALAQIAQYL